MDKEKYKEKWNKLKEKLAFLKPWDTDDAVGEELDVKEMSSSDFSRVSHWDGKKSTAREM